MDPLSAIGLASNILQFIEFGTNVCNGIHEIASSSTGLTDSNTHLSVVVDDLKRAADGLLTDLKGNNKHEVELIKLAGECKDLSAELVAIFLKLKAKKGDRLWSTVRTAWKSTLREKKVALIEKRLTDYRGQIALRLNMLLYDEQSPTKDFLTRIEQQALGLGNQHGKLMKAQHDKLRDMLIQLEAIRTENVSHSTFIGNVVEETRSLLSSLQTKATEVPHENDILRALYFASMFRRDDTINPAVGNTYRWLVEDDQSPESLDGRELQHSAAQSKSRTEDATHNLRTRSTLEEHKADKTNSTTDRPESAQVDNQNSSVAYSDAPSWSKNPWPDSEVWDREAERRSRQEVANKFRDFLLHKHSVFFIHGKAGSGKSTIMKYLADPENLGVRQCLDAWTGDCNLIFVSVFFWSAGDSLQRSLEGLYRSILYQVLRKCPRIVTKVFDHTSARLIQALDPEEYKLCLVIDGLDEYEGDSSDQVQLVENIQDWGKHISIKIICSARPHLEYMQTFNDQRRCVSLHELTKGDIFEYAVGEFQKPLTPKLEISNLFPLAKAVVMHAEGVFLWAYLVVRSLSQKLQLYPADECYNMLLETPKSLDKLFDQMLDKLDPLTQRQSEAFLLLVAHNPTDRSLNALTLSWMRDLENPGFPFENPICCYPNNEIEQRLNLARSQIADLTKGMLEIRPVTRNDDTMNFWYLVETTIGNSFFRLGFEDYLRLALAELKFSCSMDFYSHDRRLFKNLEFLVINTFSWMNFEEAAIPIRMMEQFEEIFCDYKKLLIGSIPDHERNPSKCSIFKQRFYSCLGHYSARLLGPSIPPIKPFSFLNILPPWHLATEGYLLKRITEDPSLQHNDTNMGHLFTFAAVYGARETVSLCIEKGVSLETPVDVHWGDADEAQISSRVSAWFAIIGLLMFNNRRTWREWLDRGQIVEMIDLLMEAGADSSILCLISLLDHDEPNNPSETGNIVYAEIDTQNNSLQSIIDKYRPDLVPYESIYRDLHNAPELSGQEKETSSLVTDHLKRLGFEVHDKIGGYGVAGVLRNGPGPTVLLRADMDALPMEEKTGLPYASCRTVKNKEGITVPVMHACGHDTHVVGLMGSSDLLYSAREQWSGTLIIIFQPSEEELSGAQAMLDDGLYDRIPKPDVVLAQHVMRLKTGTVSIRPGRLLTASDAFDVRIFGVGGHGSAPQACVDPIVTGAAIVTRLQSVVSREITPGELAIITCGSIQAGHAPNIIPDQLDLKLSVRSYDAKVRRKLNAAIKRIVEAECEAAGMTKKPLITRTFTAPETYNDEETVKTLKGTFGSYFGDNMVESEPATASEDFSLLARAVGAPYVMWLFGGIDEKTWDDAVARDAISELPSNHSPFFAPAIQPTLITAVDAMTVGALTFLKVKN
ncbi:hypothetical protein BJY04DRAFT_214631 [Aspergillus karnatakaensis]|uniref:uncharacterized protein n=1 Tax=Aspergillus karnatakaensis TaxID=1810916 RepID=UPI003CCE031B